MVSTVTAILLALFAALPPTLLGFRVFRPSRMPWWALTAILIILGEILIVAVAMLNETPDGGAAKVFALFCGWLYALLWVLPWLLVYGLIQGVRRWRWNRTAGLPRPGLRVAVDHMPLLLIALGIVLFLGGFVYDVFCAGIPYQDPTPEMSARYDFHSQIASAIRWIGVIVFLSGPVVGIARHFLRRS